MTRTLLIDADILAYQASVVNERKYDWGDGIHSIAADMQAAVGTAEERVARLAERLQADDVVVVLSDDFSSFRKDLVDPTYKELRTKADRPVHLYDIKDWLREEYTTHELPTLEADDVMGIMATDPNRPVNHERIIVSADKDMMTIPGLLYRPQAQYTPSGGIKKRPVVFDISEIEAIRFHFWQTLVGDLTDGFPGLPGVGPKSDYALDVLEAETEEEAWDNVLSAYGGKGLTEEDAVRQARLARILQWGDWDGRRVRLWSPPAWEDD